MPDPWNGGTDLRGRLNDLTVSERYRLLASDRRRLVLEIVAEEPTPVVLEELAREIAERKERERAADGKVVERVAITLHHNHLPTLAKAGVLNYDPELQRVDPGG